MIHSRYIVGCMFSVLCILYSYITYQGNRWGYLPQLLETCNNREFRWRLSHLNFTYMCAILRAGHIVAVGSSLGRREAWSLLGWVQVAPANFTPPVVETFSRTLFHPRPVLASCVILTRQLTFHAGILPISCRVDQVVAKIYSIVIQTAGHS